MLIPSIDLMGGRIVQLERGADLKLAFDDFDHWIGRFRAYPMVQLIDLDAAMRQGENRALVERIARRLPCQVGGGIASVSRAQELLAAGAQRVILGSALFDAQAAANRHRAAPGALDAPAAESHSSPVRVAFARSIAAALGPQRLVFSVDAREGRIAIKGWRERIDLTPEEAMGLLEPYCGAFLYTHIDREGTMSGFPLDLAARLRRCTARQLIVAGGIREQSEIDALHAMGVDAVAGMAVYLGKLPV